MATLVCFHAHPDDECIATAGTMAHAAANGHRVVLVVATGGEHGETPVDLAPGETLADRRRVETERAAEILGMHRIVWLGYEDSGMQGWSQNDHPTSFWKASVDDAADRLAAVLVEERADVITVYDWHGNYGHPDHIQVHRVGHRAAELADTPHVYEATMNREHIARLMAAARENGADIEGPGETDDGEPFGMAEADLTTALDVSAYAELKRRALACHASQVGDSSFFLTMTPEIFAMAFGMEFYIRKGAPVGIHENALAGL